MRKLNATNNQYGGTYVSPDDLPDTAFDFECSLAAAIKRWVKQKIKVVWIKIPTSKVDFLPVLYRLNFENHHCHADFFMLTKRLEADALIPPFANHTIGVGGLVFNDRREILTIREQDHVNRYPHNWKFPGGMLDRYEKFEQGVIREIDEETGIKACFESFIGFLHHNKGQFMTSNIYAVCKLKALSHEITIQESEIADARWFPVDDYLNDENISDYNQQILKSALSFTGLKSEKLSPAFFLEDYEVFFSS